MSTLQEFFEKKSGGIEVHKVGAASGTTTGTFSSITRPSTSFHPTAQFEVQWQTAEMPFAMDWGSR